MIAKQQFYERLGLQNAPQDINQHNKVKQAVEDALTRQYESINKKGSSKSLSPMLLKNQLGHLSTTVVDEEKIENEIQRLIESLNKPGKNSSKINKVDTLKIIKQMNEAQKQIELKRFGFALRKNLDYLLPQERQKTSSVPPLVKHQKKRRSTQIKVQEWDEYFQYFLMNKIQRSKQDQSSFNYIQLSDLQNKTIVVKDYTKKRVALDLKFKRAVFDEVVNFKKKQSQVFLQPPPKEKVKPYVPLCASHWQVGEDIFTRENNRIMEIFNEIDYYGNYKDVKDVPLAQPEKIEQNNHDKKTVEIESETSDIFQDDTGLIKPSKSDYRPTFQKTIPEQRKNKFEPSSIWKLSQNQKISEEPIISKLSIEQKLKVLGFKNLGQNPDKKQIIEVLNKLRYIKANPSSNLSNLQRVYKIMNNCTDAIHEDLRQSQVNFDQIITSLESQLQELGKEKGLNSYQNKNQLLDTQNQEMQSDKYNSSRTEVVQEPKSFENPYINKENKRLVKLRKERYQVIRPSADKFTMEPYQTIPTIPKTDYLDAVAQFVVQELINQPISDLTRNSNLRKNKSEVLPYRFDIKKGFIDDFPYRYLEKLEKVKQNSDQLSKSKSVRELKNEYRIAGYNRFQHFIN